MNYDELSAPGGAPETPSETSGMDMSPDEAAPVGTMEPSQAAIDDTSEVSRRAGLIPSFLAELAKAMQTAAHQERERITAIVADEANEHRERARTRAAAETEELRRLANEDVERIQAWSVTEIERIRSEAARRTDERRSNLETYLRQHEAIIATEIGGVDTAVQDYSATLERFFDELTSSTDPSEIARRAGNLPPPPDLDDVRAEARAGAVARVAESTPDDSDGAGNEGGPTTAGAEGNAPVPVMDPAATDRDLPEQSNAAVRLLRSIAPWTTPAEPEEQTTSRPG